MSIPFLGLFRFPQNLALEEELWYDFTQSFLLTVSADKLLFERVRANYLSLRTSPQTGVAIPRLKGTK